MKPAPFALLPRMDAVTRPIVFADLPAMASHIERGRCGQGLELVEIADLHHQWRAEGGGEGVDAPEGVTDRGVQIWTTDLSGGRDRCIGWAWLNGGGMERLRDALRQASAAPRTRGSDTAGGLIADSSALRSRMARAAILNQTRVA